MFIIKHVLSFYLLGEAQKQKENKKLPLYYSGLSIMIPDFCSLFAFGLCPKDKKGA